MATTTADIYDFLVQHRYAVQASHSAEGGPQAALIGFVADRRLQLFFDSFDSTRKVANLRRNPRIALVIGGHTAGDERTVQYEGVVDTPGPAELEEFKRQYFTVHPDGLRRSQLPGITYFRVNPLWIRYTDLNVKPPRIVEFAGAVIDALQDTAAPGESVHPLSGRDVPWQPQMPHDELFNPFTSPQNRTSGRS
jgi:general stress protein 26